MDVRSYSRDSTVGKFEGYAEGIVAFFSSRFALLCMTIVIALCSSSFAFDYGLNFDKRYGVLFGVALAALTFHFAKYLPPRVLSTLKWWTVFGLVLLTLFVSAAAWVSKATEKADPHHDALSESIKSLEGQISAKNMEIAALVASGNPLNAKDVGAQKFELEQILSDKRTAFEASSSGKGLYESGAMAIFGHISTVTGLGQEAVNLIVMFYILSVLIAMEISMGASATKELPQAGK